MNETRQPSYSGGNNIAMKVPPRQWDATVRFYREVLALPLIEHDPDQSATPSVVFEFGPNRLWIDRVEGIEQVEVWLEVVTPDVEAASEHLRAAGVPRRDEVEPLGEGFPGFWIANPAGVIHLVVKSGA